jgi:hypothetical protein
MKPLTKRTALVIPTLLALTLVFPIVAFPIVNAHTPAWQIPTYAYLTVAPNPIGVGQTTAVIYWLDVPPPTAGGSGGDRWRDITIDVVKPDGTTTTLGPFVSDPVGSGGTIFNPDQTGEYTFTVNFPGQTLSLYGPTGEIGTASDYVNDTYLASSATAKLTVQQTEVPGPASYPLPTGYWTRPIEGQNTAWAALASNWLGSPQIMLRVQPNGAAPETSHIMWNEPLMFGGIVGGSYEVSAENSYYPGPQYESKFANPIIINGYVYYSIPLSDQVNGAGVACVDIRTGEQMWVREDITRVTCGQLYDYESPNQHGIIANGYLWVTSGTTWSAYDPLTNLWLFDLTNVPSGTQVYGPNGEILIYQLNYAKRWLALWNNTAAPDELGGTSGTNFWQWRPVGKTINASTAYTWNVTIPDLPGSGSPAILSVIPDNMVIGKSTTLQGAGSTSSGLFGTADPYTLWAISLKPETRGQLLWLKDYPAPEGNYTVLVGPVDPDTGILTIEYRETMQWFGYDINTGKKVWGPTDPENAWNYYSGTSGALTSNTIAYGHLYTCGYGGVLYCYDTATGNLLWTYGNGGEGNSTNSGLNTVYGNYPLLIGAVADGKIYLFTSEHSPTTPLYEGALVRCVDANDGSEVWTLDGWGHTNTMAVADGYLIFYNLYDSQIYSVGKGPSATTVSAPQTVVPLGTCVMITGTVTDQSEGAKGTPAISDACMSDWMAYLYMQKPKPDAAGVEVYLTALDSNGNTQEIGTACSDSNGNYGLMWTPPIEGQYKIIATFEGTNAYGGSDATTYMGVGPAAAPSVVTPTPGATATPIQTATPTTTAPTSPSPSVAPPPTQNPATETYLTCVVVAVIVLAVVAVALVIRRRK